MVSLGFHRGLNTASATVSAISGRAAQQTSRAKATNDTLITAWKAALGSTGGSVDVAVENMTTKQIIHYSNTDTAFTTASIVKLAIAEKVLLDSQTTGQGLSTTQRAELTSMLENSDNDAATALWESVGGSDAMQGFFQTVGASDTQVDSGGHWGLTTTTALDQLKIVTVLQQPGKLLSSGSIATITDLLGNVESDQRWGISAGAPAGTTVLLKDGWLDDAETNSQYASTGDWLINSIGYLQQGGTTYAISILTDGNPSETNGIQTVQALAGATWQTLL